MEIHVQYAHTDNSHIQAQAGKLEIIKLRHIDMKFSFLYKAT